MTSSLLVINRGGWLLKMPSTLCIPRCFLRLLLISCILLLVTGQCSVCGDGKTVARPKKTVTLPGFPEASCGFIQKVGAQGYIPANLCVLAPPLITTACGCKPGKTPTVAPLKFSKKPFPAPTRKPTIMKPAKV